MAHDSQCAPPQSTAFHSPRRGAEQQRWRAQNTALLIGVFALLSCNAQEQTDSPNLLLITIDTLRADYLACYGGEPGVGEAICAIARTGTRARWAFSTAAATVPAVSSIMTSQYRFEHGVIQKPASYLHDDAVTLAEVLRDHGYSTAAFVSNPVLEPTRNLQQGFDVYDHEMMRRELNRPDLVERVAEATTDAVITWADQGVNAPWFLWVHFQDPHGPYEPPDGGVVQDEADKHLLPILTDNYGWGGIPIYQTIPGVFSFDAYSDRYSDEIRYLDPHIQRLLDRLDALGTPPAVLLTSDHGEAFGEDDFYFAHGHSVGLDQIRVPLLWRPAQPASATVLKEPASLIDVAPTLLRAAGIEAPASFRGRPIPVAGLDTVPLDPARPIFAERSPQVAIIMERTYYARTPSKRPRQTEDDNGESYLPPRSAQLGVNPALPPYLSHGEQQLPRSLFRALSDFRKNAKALKPSLHDEVPEETRKHMKALGYDE